MKKLNCWEFMKCGREPWGENVPEFGICPVVLEDRADGINSGKNAGRACWAIAGTFCRHVLQGAAASKIDTCRNCDFYKLVFKEEELAVQNAAEIREGLTRQAFVVGLSLMLNSRWHTDVWTHLIGWDSHKFLIAELPYVDGSPINLYSDDIWRVKYIKDDNAFVFTTEVIHVQYYPAPLLFFKYPSDIKKMPIRKHTRLKMNVPVRLHCDEEHVADALIADISEGGCLVKVLADFDSEFEAGKRCRLAFSILNTVFDEVEVIVRNVHTHENVKMLGMEFDDMPTENSKVIKSFLGMLKKAV